MRTVYRYEDADGRGPYNSDEWVNPSDQQDLLAQHNNDGIHRPWYTWLSQLLEDNVLPEDEFDPKEVTHEYRSGTDSREALDAWFDGWTDTLERNGFKVVEYEVPDNQVVMAKSGLQVAFKPVGV
jgi:hypothetical protein